MRGSLWLLLISCLGWLLAAAPEAAAASPLPESFTQAPLSSADAGAAWVPQNLCHSDMMASGGALECEPGATPELQTEQQAAELEAADQLRAEAEAVRTTRELGGEAPMCDESAASVGAQPVIPEANDGRFEELPCEALWALLAQSMLKGDHAKGARGLPARGEPLAPAERGAQSSERLPALREAALSLPARSEPCLLAPDLHVGLSACPGHARNVDRPPRSV